ncbi:MAG: hypothetical protein ABFD77_10380 [Thermotogota bacterium]
MKRVTTLAVGVGLVVLLALGLLFAAQAQGMLLDVSNPAPIRTAERANWVGMELMLALSATQGGAEVGSSVPQTSCSCSSSTCQGFLIDISTGAPVSAPAGPWMLSTVLAHNACGVQSLLVPGVAPVVSTNDAVAMNWMDPAKANKCTTVFSPSAHWIGEAVYACAPSLYVYELTFCLCEGFSDARIEGCLWADNDAQLWLNENLIATTPLDEAFRQKAGTPVLVTDQTYFRAGANVLTVSVRNTHNFRSPTGMLFVGSLSAQAGGCSSPAP